MQWARLPPRVAGGPESAVEKPERRSDELVVLGLKSTSSKLTCPSVIKFLEKQNITNIVLSRKIDPTHEVASNLGKDLDKCHDLG